MSIPHYHSSETGAGLVMFLVVGGILLALTAGGLYVARQRGEVAVTQPASTEQQPQPNTEVNPDAPAGEERNENEQPGSTPSPAPAAPSQPQATTPQPGQGGERPSEVAVTGPSGTAEQNPANLPATGLAENLFVAAGGLAALTMAGYTYRQSRQRFVRSMHQQ